MNRQFNVFRWLLTIQNDSTISMRVIEVLRAFRYWTLWMSKWYTVTLYDIHTVYKDMFDQTDGIMRAVARKKPQFKADSYFALKVVRQKMIECYAEVTLTSSMLVISALIFDLWRKLRSFRKWDKWIRIKPKDETFYTPQYRETFLINVEEEYIAKDWQTSIITLEYILTNHFFPTAMAAGYGESSGNACDLSSDDKEYKMWKIVVELTPSPSNRAVCWLPAARFYFNLLPEAPKNSR